MDYESFDKLEEHVSNSNPKSCTIDDWVLYGKTYHKDSNKLIPTEIWRKYSYKYDFTHMIIVTLIVLFMMWRISYDLVINSNMLIFIIHIIIILLASLVLGVMISVFLITPNINKKRRYKLILKRIEKEYEKQKELVDIQAKRN